MKRTLLIASIALVPTIAFGQNVALPERPMIVAQNEKANEQKPDAKPQQPQRQEQRQEQRQQRQENRAQQQQQRQENRTQQQEQRQENRAQQQEQRQEKRQDVQQNRQQQLQDAQQQRQENRQDAQQQRQDNRQEQQQERRDQRQDTQQNRQPQRNDAQQQQIQQRQQQDQKQQTQQNRQEQRQDRREERQDSRQNQQIQQNQQQRQDARQERREDRRMDAVRADRKERREGNRTVIQERDRTIIREGNRTIVRHNDDTRFQRAGVNEQVIRRGDRTERVIQRPNGVRIVTVVDANGRTLRRSRFVNGREYVLFTNRPSSGFGFIINVPPPIIRIPRERYIVEYRDAPPPLIYETLIAPPVMDLDRSFSLDEVRYNYDVRARMPRIDIDSVNFETGSWDVSPEQADKLAPIAEAMKRAIAANPNEVYMIEGHTDAVGSDDDNLLLSDRRAQAVTEILTEEFGVPPENMIPQGYGEQNLKVPTQGPEPRNRYVSVRRVTPLLARQQ
jgi:outer membrane protein OmpA-like peptidoglycan-associated protein